jgi:hypothetical protein
MATNHSVDDLYEKLTSIDNGIRRLVEMAESNKAAREKLSQQNRAAASAPAEASDAELDGQYGDPVIKAKDPRNWTGAPQQGKKFSECPAEYLDMVAERLDYFTSQLGDSDEDKKKRGYNMKDAARARGWAKRIRNGWKPAPKASTFGDDETFGSEDKW